MVIDRRSSLGSLGCVMCLTLLGCAAGSGEDSAVSSGAALEAAPELMVTPFEDADGTAAIGDGEIRRTLSSAGQYERVFGHAPPAGVNLRGSRIAIFYSPGVQSTGGYEASFEKVEVRGRTLLVTTRLTSPGPNCRVTEALTHPSALATLRRPRNVSRVRFTTDDVVRDCEVPPTCDGTECTEGEHCQLTPVTCITAPCPAIPECVPDEKITCGGFGGFPCPDDLTCVDDPSDSCDPNNGGADCGGICRCVQNVLCVRGTHFDSSSDVCACVPNPVCIDNVLCVQGTHFDSSSDVCACVPDDPTQDPCAAVRCAAGTHCEATGDGAGCVSDGPFCGGIGGFDCPGAADCIEDPNDGCDLNNGGADCGGHCACNALGLCESGYVWDSSPDVCGCVLENPCIATLCQVGTTCEVIDGGAVCLSDGTEACGSTTCGKGTSCCNASCGMCAEPGFACIQIACLPTQ
jgi:hypothetical protein